MSATSWTPRDNHAHSTFSDGALAPRDVVAAGRARGVRPSITDHLSGDVGLGVATVDGVRDYLDTLEAIARESPELAIGGEFCWHDALWREIPPDMWSRFTHVVGSIHAVYLPDGSRLHAFQREWPGDLEAQAYMDAHIDNLEIFAREMPVEILAHPTLLPLALRKRPLEELWTEPREERAVAALKQAGIAFEVSNRYRPHERFVRRAVDAGVQISLGSDGHHPNDVANVAWPLQLTRSLGVPDESLYDPSTHGRRSP